MSNRILSLPICFLNWDWKFPSDNTYWLCIIRTDTNISTTLSTVQEQRQLQSFSKIKQSFFLVPVQRVAVKRDKTLGSASPFLWNIRRGGGVTEISFFSTLNPELLFNYKTECQDIINWTEKGKRKHALFFFYKWGSELLPIKVNQICFSQKFQPKGRMPNILNR